MRSTVLFCPTQKSTSSSSPAAALTIPSSSLSSRPLSPASKSCPLPGSVFRKTPRKLLPSHFSRTNPSTSHLRPSLLPPARAAPLFSVKSLMPRRANFSIQPHQASPFFSSLRPQHLRDLWVKSFPMFFLLLALATAYLSGCSNRNQPDPASHTFLIDSSPTNLDPRFATDSQSQRIDGLLFSGLLERDNQMNFHGDLAESWSTPDPLTYVFHLRHGVRFHDGRALTATDVKATFEFIMNPATNLRNGELFAWSTPSK